MASLVSIMKQGILASLLSLFNSSQFFFRIVAINHLFICNKKINTAFFVFVFFRKKSNVLTYNGNNKHFTKSVVNSVLGLTYIILVAPKGVFDIIQTKNYLQGNGPTDHDFFIDLVLYLVATGVAISNPIIYTFLTSR